MFTKVNREVLAAWAKILDAVPGSRLRVLLVGLVQNNRHIPALFDECGLLHRVEFVDFAPQPKYLKQYQDVDISLDPFPYNSHTTGLDSLFMGVPIVTFGGESPVARAGSEFLKAFDPALYSILSIGLLEGVNDFFYGNVGVASVEFDIFHKLGLSAFEG